MQIVTYSLGLVLTRTLRGPLLLKHCLRRTSTSEKGLRNTRSPLMANSFFPTSRPAILQWNTAQEKRKVLSQASDFNVMQNHNEKQFLASTLRVLKTSISPEDFYTSQRNSYTLPGKGDCMGQLLSPGVQLDPVEHIIVPGWIFKASRRTDTHKSLCNPGFSAVFGATSGLVRIKGRVLRLITFAFKLLGLISI